MDKHDLKIVREIIRLGFEASLVAQSGRDLTPGKAYRIERLNDKGDPVIVDNAKDAIKIHDGNIEHFSGCTAAKEALEQARKAVVEREADDLKRLRALALHLIEPQQQFKPGDVIGWKEGLAHKKDHGPYVVTEVFDDPLYDKEQDPGSPYYREPLDIKAAFFSPATGDVLEVHLDSRRMSRL